MTIIVLHMTKSSQNHNPLNEIPTRSSTVGHKIHMTKSCELESFKPTYADLKL